MQMALPSRLIFTVIGVSLPVAAHAADMNQTHIYNPRWPPHAKFHNGQTLSMSLLLGALTTFLAWWPSNNVPAMVAASACAASRISSRKAPRFYILIRPISIQNSSLSQSEEFRLQS